MAATREAATERVADFYEGKSVLITGAAGFLGGVLLELLLRCCPGLNAAYVVLRAKKGVTPIDRREQITDKPIFDKLKEENPWALDKIRVIAGDTSLPEFGLCQDDLQEVIEEVSIVFHCAASLNFNKTFIFILHQNVMSVKYAIDLSRQLKKLDALIYTSTSFGNVNKPLEIIEEIVYRLPYRGDRFVEEILKGDEASMSLLASQCGTPWPNNYCFSKCVAENLLQDTASDLPAAILRPSIIANIWKGHLPGYAEEGSGVMLLFSGISKGFVRVMRGNTDTHIDLTPVDVVANSHVLAALKVAKRKCKIPLVINIASRKNTRLNYYEFSHVALDLAARRTMPNSYQLPRLVLASGACAYWYHAILEHYAPALVVDTLLRITGRKPKLWRLYRIFEQAIADLRFFACNDWEQEDANRLALADGLDPEDVETFVLDQTDYRVNEMIEELLEVLPIFKSKKQGDDKDTYRTLYRRSLFTYFIKCCVLSIMGWILYKIIYYSGKICGIF